MPESSTFEMQTFRGSLRGDIFIVLNDIPLDNWGIRGGVPASEVDIGFKVDV